MPRVCLWIVGEYTGCIITHWPGFGLMPGRLEIVSCGALPLVGRTYIGTGTVHMGGRQLADDDRGDTLRALQPREPGEVQSREWEYLSAPTLSTADQRPAQVPSAAAGLRQKTFRTPFAIADVFS